MNLKTILSDINQGKLQQSKNSLQYYLASFPKCVDGLNLLGLCLQRLNDSREAVVYFRQACDISPDHFKSRVNLAISQAQIHDYDSAIESFRKCEKLSPKNADVLNALGNLYRITGRVDAAADYLQRAQQLSPDHPAIMENTALLDLKLGKYQTAKQRFSQLISAFPGKLQLHLGLAEALYKSGELQQARSRLLPLLKQPNLLDKVHNLLALIEKKSDNILDAVEHYVTAIKYNSDNAEIHFNLAMLYKEMGQNEQSQRHFLNVINLKPDWFEAYFHLTYSPKFIVSEQLANGMLAIENCHTDHKEIYWLRFALAKYYEKTNQYRQAFEYLNLARLSFAKQRSGSQEKPRPFNELKKLPESHDTQKAHGYVAHQSFIFVTGLPRSGTTLTEQILAAHKNTHAIGESGLVSQMAKRVEQITSKPYYLGAYDLSCETKQKLIENLCDAHNLPREKSIVDATPNNLFYAGFIAEMFANSKVIICRRSPLDNCLSIYQHPLNQQAYSDTLNSLADHYQQCDQLTEHWLTTLSHSSHEVIYESLVTHPETQISNLLERLGLGFDEACFHPETNKRVVRTPSSEQVRQPISTAAIGKWQRFAPYLGSITVSLEQLEAKHAKRIDNKQFSEMTI